MNKTLPIELINLIFSYMSSPVAEIFENETNYINYSYYEQAVSTYSSFSRHFFNIKNEEKIYIIVQKKFNDTYKKYYSHYMGYVEYCFKYRFT